MQENAVKKIKEEMEKSKNNSYVQVVGEFLLSQLNIYPAIAEKIMNADKSIEKSLEEMRKEASKKRVGNCAVLTDQEGFEIVSKYFGIDTKSSENVTKTIKNDTKSTVIVTEKAKNATADQNIDFNVKLEDLLKD